MLSCHDKKLCIKSQLRHLLALDLGISLNLSDTKCLICEMGIVNSTPRGIIRIKWGAIES